MSFLESISQNLPSRDGFLPSWLLFISAVSVFNSAQTYVADTTLTKRVYERRPDQVTPLSARTFGTWTMMASMIRFFGAYYISDPAVYNMTMWTFILAGFHFGTEWLVFGTAKLGKGLAGPLFTVALTLPWMILQKDYYLEYGYFGYNIYKGHYSREGQKNTSNSPSTSSNNSLSSRSPLSGESSKKKYNRRKATRRYDPGRSPCRFTPSPTFSPLYNFRENMSNNGSPGSPLRQLFEINNDRELSPNMNSPLYSEVNSAATTATITAYPLITTEEMAGDDDDNGSEKDGYQEDSENEDVTPTPDSIRKSMLRQMQKFNKKHANSGSNNKKSKRRHQDNGKRKKRKHGYLNGKYDEEFNNDDNVERLKSSNDDYSCNDSLLKRFDSLKLTFDSEPFAQSSPLYVESMFYLVYNGGTQLVWDIIVPTLHFFSCIVSIVWMYLYSDYYLSKHI